MIAKSLVVVRVIVVQTIDQKEFALTKLWMLLAISSDKWFPDFVAVKVHVIT